MDFVHLKTQSEFSIKESILFIDKMVKKMANDNMGALAITDKNGLFGAINFYKNATQAGIKPIIGIDITVKQDDGNTYQLTLLAKNENGYKSLLKLNSKGYTEPLDNYKTYSVKEEWLGELTDVIVLSGAKHGLIGQNILNDKLDEAKEIAQNMKDYFGDDFYIELQRDGTNDETKYMEGAVDICASLNIPPVATHPCLFNNPDEFLTHEARVCLANKEKLFSIAREQKYNKEMYLKTSSEMIELFSDLPEAIENTVQIAKKCNIKIELGKSYLPKFPTPENETIDEHFTRLSLEGLNQRLLEDYPDENVRKSKEKEYNDRLLWEIEIIKKMGFPSYFLIVSDFINWGKSHDVPVGPGRGSGAGSLVAYAMGITDLDPIPYGLFFERFLNPERVSMPDFDIDFCPNGRDSVFEYVKDKYGEASVAHIGTFGTYAARAALRSAGRVLDYPYGKVDGLSKLITIKTGSDMTLKEFIWGDEEKGIPPNEALLEEYKLESNKKLIDIAVNLEGITNNVGTHAAGVIISPTVLTDFTPLYSASSDKVSSQYNMKDVEPAGLVKYDFLGLGTLTIINNTIKLINKDGKNNFNIRKIDLNDQSVYQNIFMKGNTRNIFQFESEGMTGLLRKVKPTTLEDLMAVTAIYRPGPMDIIPDWLAARNMSDQELLEKNIYPHPSLVGLLKETSGFMIYQEQVMKCAQIIAGYSLGGADLLRRAMGKKQPEEMAKQRAIFIEGAAKNNIDSEKANSLFDLMEKFAGYGFNKSHAAAYAYVSYQTAYLKHHYPLEFFCSNLNENISTTPKISLLIKDAKKNNINIKNPDINFSEGEFSITENNSIIYGLKALKGVADKTVKDIISERNNNGHYKDFFDLIDRVPTMNKKTLVALITSGALDSFDVSREAMFENVDKVLDYKKKFNNYKTKIADIPVVLSDSMDGEVKKSNRTKAKPKVAIIPLRPDLNALATWDENEIAKNEKTAFGFYFKRNPFETYYSKQLGGLETATSLAVINHFNALLENPIVEEEQHHDEYTEQTETNIPSSAFVAGMIEEYKPWKSQKGGFLTIDDGTGSITIMVYADFVNENKNWIKKDNFISLKVKMAVSYDSKEDKDKLTISLQNGFNFEQTKKLTTERIFVGIDGEEESLLKLKEILSNNDFAGSRENNDPVLTVCVPNKNNNNRRNKVIDNHFIKADPKLIHLLTENFGHEWVSTQFKKDVDNIDFPKYNGINKNNYKRKNI